MADQTPRNQHDALLRWRDAMANELRRQSEHHLRRVLRPVGSSQGAELVIEGRRYVQFCTNNYLGLANHPEVVDAVREAASRWGVGSGASRLVAGSMQLHHELEEKLAAFKGTDAALLFPTGFMANLAMFTTFADQGDRIVSDKLNHASLIDSARYSQAEHRIFPHRDLARAAALLAKPMRPTGRASPGGGEGVADESSELPIPRGMAETNGPGLMFIATDAVFSMDGDLADLPGLCDIAEAHGALVVVDEAHATGVFGTRGRGLAEAQGVCQRVALSMGTLSKALGSVGGFVCGPREAIDMLVNKARTFIYTTALPPVCSAAGLAALGVMARQPHRRQRLLAMATHVREELEAMGFNCGNSRSPIIPVMAGSAEAALAASAQLRERGLFVPAIRPPTVPADTARLRISLMADHTDGHIEQLLQALQDLGSTGKLSRR
ncbi:MAG: 8-amino-7-oxononanoate synthase [Phycisphaerales bacterium]|nr:8-amino-7-oxononanoate synthase [Phycisphaerales bacterium]